MDTSSPVEVRLSLSPDLLDRLLRLTQQVQALLADTPVAGDIPSETVNPAFDPLRFQALTEADAQSEAVAVFSAVDAPAIAVAADRTPLDDPMVAQFPVDGSPPPPASASSAPAEDRISAVPDPSLSVNAVSAALRRDCRRYDSSFPLL